MDNRIYKQHDEFLSQDQLDKKRSECIVRLKIRENDVKSQMWRLMNDNSLDSVTDVEKEVSKIFEDLDMMIIDLFKGIEDEEYFDEEDLDDSRL
jgi:hypothetical protein